MYTITITKTFQLKWQFVANPDYKLTDCGRLFNTKTKREIKRTLNGRTSVGYWIGKKFYSLKKIKEQIIFELINKS
jgi:hypothetical protein